MGNLWNLHPFPPIHHRVMSLIFPVFFLPLFLQAPKILSVAACVPNPNSGSPSSRFSRTRGWASASSTTTLPTTSSPTARARPAPGASRTCPAPPSRCPRPSPSPCLPWWCTTAAGDTAATRTIYSSTSGATSALPHSVRHSGPTTRTPPSRRRRATIQPPLAAPVVAATPPPAVPAPGAATPQSCPSPVTLAPGPATKWPHADWDEPGEEGKKRLHRPTFHPGGDSPWRQLSKSMRTTDDSIRVSSEFFTSCVDSYVFLLPGGGGTPRTPT